MKRALTLSILLILFAGGVWGAEDESITIHLTGMCTDLEKPSTSQEARVYDVNAYVDVYLENRRLVTKRRVALLEGNYAMNPPNYELPKISLNPINLSVLEEDKWVVESTHVYGDSVYRQVSGECKLTVCASPRCFLIDLD